MKRICALVFALLIVLTAVAHADGTPGFHSVNILGYQFDVPDDSSFQNGEQNGGVFMSKSLNGPLYFLVLHDAKKMIDALSLDYLQESGLKGVGITAEKNENITINDLPAIRWQGTHVTDDGVNQASGVTFIHDDEIVLFILDNYSGSSRDNDENAISVIIDSLKMPTQPEQTVVEVYDLTGMSFDELLALKDQINAALWASDEWQEVTVPVGVYQIGIDIPAGKWTISATPTNYSRIKHGKSLMDGGDVSTWYGASEDVYPRDYWSYDEGDPTEIHWDLMDGEYFQVEYSAVVFTPFAGLNLGFK